MQERGLEPLHLSVQAPKTCASASSATPACQTHTRTYVSTPRHGSSAAPDRDFAHTSQRDSASPPAHVNFPQPHRFYPPAADFARILLTSENSLWTALRSMEETADLRRRMARRISKVPFGDMRERYLTEAAEFERERRDHARYRDA